MEVACQKPRIRTSECQAGASLVGEPETASRHGISLLQPRLTPGSGTGTAGTIRGSAMVGLGELRR